MKTKAIEEWVVYDPKKTLKGFFDVRTTDGQEYYHCWYLEGNFYHSRFTVRGELVARIRGVK